MQILAANAIGSGKACCQTRLMIDDPIWVASSRQASSCGMLLQLPPRPSSLHSPPYLRCGLSVNVQVLQRPCCDLEYTTHFKPLSAVHAEWLDVFNSLDLVHPWVPSVKCHMTEKLLLREGSFPFFWSFLFGLQSTFNHDTKNLIHQPGTA